MLRVNDSQNDFTDRHWGYGKIARINTTLCIFMRTEYKKGDIVVLLLFQSAEINNFYQPVLVIPSPLAMRTKFLPFAPVHTCQRNNHFAVTLYGCYIHTLYKHMKQSPGHHTLWAHAVCLCCVNCIQKHIRILLHTYRRTTEWTTMLRSFHHVFDD